MTDKRGNISIEAHNIMPIIKKWLYSDKDIFIRELVANGTDAITKHRMLNPDAVDNYRVVVTVDKEAKTLSFDDNGIGMTADEIEKYINQVAFSSAEEFLKNYEGEDAENKGGIIGHFGLGFYSAFMVAKKVTILSKSYVEGSQAVTWVSEDGMSFEMSAAEKEDYGTLITLDIADDEMEFLDTYRVREVLKRYCEFMKVPVYLRSIEDIKAAQKRIDEAAKKAAEDEKTEEDGESKEDNRSEVKSAEEQGTYRINDVYPLWLKKPSDVADNEYNEFYHKLFGGFEDPLFQVHLNVDYPFNLKGILYFPKLKQDFGVNEGQIKLFSGQVFVADNIKEVIPEYLLLLNGVIDCPDLPLNVSRSYLQNDGFVRKMKAYITRKVADRLVGLFNNKREEYEGYWDDINPFIKYGCIRDEKFFESLKECLLLKTSKDEYFTLKEYLDKNEEKIGKKIYYAADAKRQAAAIALYTDREIDVIILNTIIDNNFISFMEYSGGIEGLKFVRVDADVDGLAGEKEHSDEELKSKQEKLQELFRKALNKDDLIVQVKELADENLPALMLQDEQGRRFTEMSRFYGQNLGFGEQSTLVLNAKNIAVNALLSREEDEISTMIAKQMYDLARMATRPLEDNEVTEFLSRSNKMLALLLK
ncbi:MAG: molecular chaperone HtpG [Christensenellaceae bacterium]|nr:molecular chaperone HtpG [Christensenellaceae bacterium]